MIHPTWCTSKHLNGRPVHETQIGADLELSHDLAYAVYLQQVHGDVAEVNLIRHDRDETILTRLTPLEAGILRDLLGEGLAMLAVEVGRPAVAHILRS